MPLLQWSRFFSKRKTRKRKRIRKSSAHRFNGAAFFQSGKHDAIELSSADQLGLQWSRFFSKRKTACTATSRCATPAASMEPLFFKAENTPCGFCEFGGWRRSFNGAAFFQSGKLSEALRPQAGRCPASMEPLFFKAENNAVGYSASLPPPGFNGAAFFQSGKPVTALGGLDFSLGLQWSRFFSKRKTTANAVVFSAR